MHTITIESYELSTYYNLPPGDCIAQAIENKQWILSDSGALVVDTGEFTGRSPRDKYIVLDGLTRDTVCRNDINQAFDPQKFDLLYDRFITYISKKKVYVRDVVTCHDERYQITIRSICEYPRSDLFVHNMFILGNTKEETTPTRTIVCAPWFHADPQRDGTRQHNFTIINFSKKIILIGWSGYTGEIKKAVFTVMNFILPHDHHVLSMHCATNRGKSGDTALFFGLSGTGKTTLSTDPHRILIGDDEHGRSDDGVFNIEWWCYAKCLGLSEQSEPHIFHAIRWWALVENVSFIPWTKTIDFADDSKTENTRVSYPLSFIENTVSPARGDVPKHIFFLSCDACGVLPPIAKLTREQAMYYFLSGYTAKVAATEMGIIEPAITFSACFGAAFLPLHPTVYAELLREKLDQGKITVRLVNTGWIGWSYGIGNRIPLTYTRRLIHAALDGELDTIEYRTLPLFDLSIPTSCPDIPDGILDPRQTWWDGDAYDHAARDLTDRLKNNFSQYHNHYSTRINTMWQ